MSITQTTTKVTAQGKATITRVCSGCKKSWTEQQEIEATAKDETWFTVTSEDVAKLKEKAQEDLERQEKWEQKQANTHILCPYCGHFSVEAMEKHFPKGYLAGFKRRYRRAFVYALIFAPLLGLGAYFLGQVVWGSSAEEWKSYWFVIIPFALIGLALVWGCYENLKNAIRILVGSGRVSRFLRTVNEDDFLELAIAVYKKNNESLSGNIDWAEVLLERSKTK